MKKKPKAKKKEWCKHIIRGYLGDLMWADGIDFDLWMRDNYKFCPYCGAPRPK